MSSRLEIGFGGGRVDIRADGAALVRLLGMGPEVACQRRGQAMLWRPPLHACGELAAEGRGDGLRFRLEVEPRGNVVILSARLRNESPAAIHLTRVTPLRAMPPAKVNIGSGADRWSVFRNGYQSWTGTRSFRMREVDRNPVGWPLRIMHLDPRRPSPARPGHFRSDLFLVVKNLRSGEIVVAGFLDSRTAFGGLELAVVGDRCTKWTAFLDYDEVPLEPGEEIATAPLWIAAGFDQRGLLAAYAAAAGDFMCARLPPRAPVGWCSWYYYFRHVTEDGVLENARALAGLRSRLPFEYVQIDDGYQAAIGDWTKPGAGFPHGMGWLAEQIRGAGLAAGIWTAPFIAGRDSKLLAEHPEWWVRNRRGRPRIALWNPLWGWLGWCYALDTTHPDVLDWLRSTFRTLSREWGYRILKLDFLFAAALPGRRYDPRATRAAALRRGLEAIREGAGDDAFLLGCGCPLGPAVGVVDAMRIGADVTPFWSNALSRMGGRGLHGPATIHAVRNTLARAFLHRRWWLNDPDCLMVRDTETRLSLEEVRALAAAIALTGGMIVLSDRVAALSAERIRLLEQAFRLRGAGAEVVDVMEADVPGLVVARTPDSAAVGVFNFSAQAERREVDLKDLGLGPPQGRRLLEAWTGAELAVNRGRVDMGEIPAHGCRVLLVPRGEPASQLRE